MGIIVLTIISLNFIDENDLNSIKQKVKNISSCTDENFKNFGIKKSFNDLSYIFGVIGAFWGASYTVEKNIGKWWGVSSKQIFIIKVISIIIVNTFFIFLKYLLPKLFDNYEINFIINSILNFFQNFFSFGMIPLFLQHMELIEKKKLKKYDSNLKKSIKDEEDDDNVILFKTSIFKDEKQKGDDEGFVILDKEIVKKSQIKEEKKIEENKINNETENENEKLSKSDDEENEIIYDKKEEEKDVIYSPSPLVENVHKLDDDEEEYNLVLEGMNEDKENNFLDDLDE